MSQDNCSSSRGLTFTGLLTIVFIVLKLTDVIDWSWWLVLLPEILVLIIELIILIFIFITSVYDHYKFKR